jgi:predicted nucleic acid-binding protein
MIHLDTNFLIAIEDAKSPESILFRSWLENGEEVGICALAWTEYLCGPLGQGQIQSAAALFPLPEPFLSEDATIAARLFTLTGRRRGSMMDCMIAAIAIRHDAIFATINREDFRPFEKFGLRMNVHQ